MSSSFERLVSCGRKMCVAPGMRPYDLRHAYVSLMIQAGHTVVEVRVSIR